MNGKGIKMVGIRKTWPEGFFRVAVQFNNLYIPKGFPSWMDGRIFWPDNTKTMFWSDILLGPTLLFSFLRRLGIETFSAYKTTIFLLSAASYGSLLVLLLRFGQWSGFQAKQLRSHWIALFFCFTLAFSINQISYFQHFQNLCWFGLILLFLGLGGFSCTGHRKYFVLALTAETTLLYSAPYFAVIGTIFFGIWIFLHMTTRPDKIRGDIKATWPLWAMTGLLGSIPVILYHNVPHVTYDPSMLYQELATRLMHLWTPSQGMLYDWLIRAGLSLPEIHHESPAYLGIGFCLLLAGGIVILALDIKRQLSSFFLSRVFPALGLIYLVYRLLRDVFPPVGYVLAWVSLLLFLTILFAFIRKKAKNSQKDFLAAMMLTAALISIGLSIGPNHHYLNSSPNPSIYGLLKLLIPGVNNMRAIGRMAAVGHACLGVWLFLEYCHLLTLPQLKNSRSPLATFIIIALSLQTIEAWPVKAKMNKYAITRIQPTSTDNQKLRSLNGVACVFPIRPWPKNTHSMLYFISSEQLRLINGYSARSTPLLDQLMAAGRKGEEPTHEQLEILRNTDCRFFMIWKRKISRRHLQYLKENWSQVMETEQMVIMKL